MEKMKQYIIANLIFIASLFASCTDVVSIDLVTPNRDQLVVEAIVTNEPGPKTVTLTLAQAYFDSSSPRPASNATVTITEEGGATYPFIENTTTKGMYQSSSSFNPTVGHTYYLSISYDGETYSSTVTMGKSILVNDLTYAYGTSSGRGGGGNNKGSFTYTATVTDNPDQEGDRYYIRSYFNDTLQVSQERILIKNDNLYSNETIPSGKTYTFTIRGDGSQNGTFQADGVTPNTVRFDFLSIDQASYSFLLQIRDQSRTGLFSPPPANILSNVKNVKEGGMKALGLFCVSPIQIFKATLNENNGKTLQNNRFTRVFPTEAWPE